MGNKLDRVFFFILKHFKQMPGEQPETGHDCLLAILVLLYVK